MTRPAIHSRKAWVHLLARFCVGAAGWASPSVVCGGAFYFTGRWRSYPQGKAIGLVPVGGWGAEERSAPPTGELSRQRGPEVMPVVLRGGVQTVGSPIGQGD